MAYGGADALCERHGVRLLAAFGSATREGRGEPADLDVALALAPHAGGDVLSLLADLADMAGTDAIDPMDLDRAGPVAREPGARG